MELYAADRRITAAIKIVRLASTVLAVSLLFVLVLTQPTAAQQLQTTPVFGGATLTAEQVVENLVEMNLRRFETLLAYEGTRTYRLEYRGFPGPRSAEMVVDMKFRSPRSKEFTVQSATGSKLIIDKVFRKLLDAETEALDEEVQRRSALSPENYEFTLVNYESNPSGADYVLIVTPKTKDKFLFRGRIWVDARDFAVTRLEAEPAKKPSVWTRKAEIVQVYSKVNQFWLPSFNHSVSAIRFGGHAELTIEYSNYQITSSSSAGNLLLPESSRPQVASSALPQGVHR